VHPGALALITPALFSHPSTHPPGRRGRKTETPLLKPLSPRQGGRRDGREGLGSEGPGHPAGATHSPSNLRYHTPAP